MSADTSRLMASGWRYGGRTNGQQIWESPDGRTMFAAEALAEIDNEETKMTDNRPLTGAAIEEFASDQPTFAARRLARIAGFDARMKGARTMHAFFNRVVNVVGPSADERERLVKAAGLDETKQERRARLQRERPPEPTRLVADGVGGFGSEPIRHERHLRGIAPDFGEIASAAERAKLERRERWVREQQEERNEERRRAAEHEPEPQIDGLFGR